MKENEKKSREKIANEEMKEREGFKKEEGEEEGEGVDEEEGEESGKSEEYAQRRRLIGKFTKQTEYNHNSNNNGPEMQYIVDSAYKNDEKV
jgi:hypothetical protein